MQGISSWASVFSEHEGTVHQVVTHGRYLPCLLHCGVQFALPNALQLFPPRVCLAGGWHRCARSRSSGRSIAVFMCVSKCFELAEFLVELPCVGDGVHGHDLRCDFLPDGGGDESAN